MIRLLFLAPLLLATGAARDPLEGRIAGPPSNCINLSRNTSPQIVDARTILYRESGRRTWRTGPVGYCPSLRPFTTLIVDTYNAQLCRNDRFRVLEQNAIIASGTCRFDRFTPYDKPPR